MDRLTVPTSQERLPLNHHLHTQTITPTRIKPICLTVSPPDHDHDTDYSFDRDLSKRQRLRVDSFFDHARMYFGQFDEDEDAMNREEEWEMGDLSPPCFPIERIKISPNPAMEQFREHFPSDVDTDLMDDKCESNETIKDGRTGRAKGRMGRVATFAKKLYQ